MDIRVKIAVNSNSIKLQEKKIMQLKSQEMRKLAPELDPLRIGTGWKKEDLGKVQVMVESTYGDSHPGSGHLNILVEEVRKGIAEEGGFGARYHCTDICDGESQGTDGINYSLASREMIANMIEIHANATPFDAGVYLSSCDKGVPGSASPSASAMICIVDAVPIKEHAPQLGQALHFAQSSFSSSISPRSNLALYIPSCSRVSISGPAFIVPPGTNTDGILTLASPIRFPGTPLSQLER